MNYELTKSHIQAATMLDLDLTDYSNTGVVSTVPPVGIAITTNLSRSSWHLAYAISTLTLAMGTRKH